MKTHTRCRSFGHRRKLNRHPDEYRVQPQCNHCGARDWRKDLFRHRVELPQIQGKLGRYRSCHCDGYAYAHRIGFGLCKWLIAGKLKSAEQMGSDYLRRQPLAKEAVDYPF